MQRIRSIKLVATMDPVGSAESDRRADWAMAKAWDLLFRKGLAVELTPEIVNDLRQTGATDADLRALDQTLSMCTQDMMSEARTLRIIRAFQELTGRTEQPSALEILNLRKLFVAGRAAAWAQADLVDQHPTAELAAHLAREIATDMAQREISAVLGAGSRAMRADAPSPAPVTASPSTSPADPLYDADISAIAQRIVDRKSQRRKPISPATRSQFLRSATLFQRITGISDIREIQPAHVTRFYDVMKALPKSWGKHRADAGAPMAEILTRARGLPPEEIGLEISTLNRHLGNLQSVIDWARKEGMAIPPGVCPKDLFERDPERARDKRRAFGADELRKVFRHSLWTGCKGLRQRHEPGSKIIRDAHFWAPIIAAYTGARREEIAALRVTDIGEEDGIPFFRFEENANRGVKTAAGVRRVPLHSRLIELGFPAYVEKMRDRRQGDLFPELKPGNHVKGGLRRFGEALSYHWRTSLRAALDGNPRGYDFHALRHYVNNLLLHETEVPKAVRLDLIGHEGEGTNERVYSEESKLAELQRAIECLPAVV